MYIPVKTFIHKEKEISCMLVSRRHDHLEGEFLLLIAPSLWLRALQYCSERHDLSLSGVNCRSIQEGALLEMHGPVHVAQHETTHKKSGSLENLDRG
jgi:hypothetical protein